MDKLETNWKNREIPDLPESVLNTRKEKAEKELDQVTKRTNEIEGDIKGIEGEYKTKNEQLDKQVKNIEVNHGKSTIYWVNVDLDKKELQIKITSNSIDNHLIIIEIIKA
ncbi:hypothetical protein [Tenuibacillus multivorans]|uniref:hypothetical protein n=1 Tax=Tenuibacillus multivorans TaxID=237069 RepID=UPI000B8A1AC1|nr:hypothetical protein [Tenuibacillus multivorans]GEL77055.1 hypothetical protein TMU01_12900 [Tenuibacillus multivorans]